LKASKFGNISAFKYKHIMENNEGGNYNYFKNTPSNLLNKNYFPIFLLISMLAIKHYHLDKDMVKIIVSTDYNRNCYQDYKTGEKYEELTPTEEQIKNLIKIYTKIMNLQFKQRKIIFIANINIRYLLQML